MANALSVENDSPRADEPSAANDGQAGAAIASTDGKKPLTIPQPFHLIVFLAKRLETHGLTRRSEVQRVSELEAEAEEAAEAGVITTPQLWAIRNAAAAIYRRYPSWVPSKPVSGPRPTRPSSPPQL